MFSFAPNTKAKSSEVNFNFAGLADGSEIEPGAILPNHLKGNASSNNDWSFDDWAPSYSNITVGNGTVVAKYIRIGDLVLFEYDLVLGSTSSIGTDPTISLPVTSVSYPSSGNMIAFGDGRDGALVYPIYALWKTTTTMELSSLRADLSFLRSNALGASAPFSWGTADELWLHGWYRAAA